MRIAICRQAGNIFVLDCTLTKQIYFISDSPTVCLAARMGGYGPDLSALSLLSQESLSSVLLGISGKKQLVLEPGLMRPLDRVAKMSVLTAAGVENVFKFDRKAAPALKPGQTRVYLVSANLIQAKLVADQVTEFASSTTDKVHVILLPRKLQAIERLFEEEGLAGHTVLHEFSWEFVPLDYDLLSLELPQYFRSHYLCGDTSLLPAVARALWGLQSLFGTIPNVFGQGKSVTRLLKLETLYNQTFGKPRARTPEIGHLVILDRDLDWASCLLSPLTYEGLLDETFGISCGTVEFPTEVTKTDTPTKLQLSCRDKMFDKIRNKHFATIFTVLGVTAKQLAAAQGAASSMSVTQMKQFVANELRVMKTQSKAVALHIGASEAIQREKGNCFESQLPVEHSLVASSAPKESVAYIEDCMAQLRPLTLTLRLLCLLSHCSDGLSLPDYQRLKTQFVQAYGFQHLVTWNNLLKVGLVQVKGGLEASQGTQGRLGLLNQHVAGLAGALAGKTGSFQALVKRLGLVPPEQGSLSEPTSAGYVFNGAYVPLACRLVQEVLKAGPTIQPTSVLGEALKLLPGDTVHTQALPGAEVPKVVLVLFLGGYTLAEVAAFRWLQTVTGYQFVVAGTNSFGGNKLAEDMQKL